MTWIKKGRLEFDYEQMIPDSPKPIMIDGFSLQNLINYYVHQSKITKNVFDNKSKKIDFPIIIEKLHDEVFNTIKDIIQIDKDIELAARLASRFYEFFTTYWHYTLLNDGLVITGRALWERILELTKNWESKNHPIEIHKGSLYYFLAQNFLIAGDKDFAFTYIYNAIENDTVLGKLQPAFNYPKEAPAFKTATFSGDKLNMLYPLMEELRKELQLYISKTNTFYGTSFSIKDFDTKFCQNNDLLIRVYFFTSNFLFLYRLNHELNKDLLQNDFSGLRISDLIFNFCLIIDELLKYICKKHGQPITILSKGVEWICNKNSWISNNDLTIVKNTIQFKTQPPSIIIPKIIHQNLTHNGNPIKKEIHPFLLANYLRNHTAHNLTQQRIFTSHYEEILEMLLSCLFLTMSEL